MNEKWYWKEGFLVVTHKLSPAEVCDLVNDVNKVLELQVEDLDDCR